MLCHSVLDHVIVWYIKEMPNTRTRVRPSTELTSLLPNTAEEKGKTAAERAGHAEHSAEHVFSRTRVQPNTDCRTR